MIFPGGAFAAFGLGAGLGYVAGSFPSAYLAGRLMRGVDLRTVGSGNLGATNVLREVGIPAAVAVLLIDAAKGWAPVALLPDPLGASTSSWLPIAIGAGAVLGHTRPLFLLWKGGGKGVATAAGVFLALAPLALAVAACVFVIGVAATRFVSVGSIAAAAALPFAIAATAGTGAPVFPASIIVGLYVVWTHRANIGRLLRGEESPLRAARRKE